MAKLSLACDHLTNELAERREQELRLSQNIWPLYLGGQIMSGTTSTLDQPTSYGPRTGQGWSIQRISCSGLTAGSWVVRMNDPVGGDLLAQFTAAGVQYFGKGAIFLTAGQRLTFNAAGTGGAVTFAIAGVQMAADVIADYLL